MALKNSKKTKKSKSSQLRPIQRLSLFFFSRSKTTALLWLVITLFGILSYTTLLQREGFPTINTPIAVAQGTYLVNDPAKVEKEVARPIGDFVLKQAGVKSVQTQSFDNFYTVIITYKSDVNAKTRSSEIQQQINDQKIIPPQATLNLKPYEFGYTSRGDNLVVSFYSKDPAVPTQELLKQADAASEYIKAKNLPLVASVSPINPYEEATNPLTGEKQKAQKTFDRYGERQNDENNFFNSIVIGVKATDGADELELDKQVQSAVDQLNKDPQFDGYHSTISASSAPQIKEQVSELQQALFEGLIAILIVGSLIIAVRASLIIVISMVTVIATVNGLMYLIGYSLNTITLFALILGLSLIVDDTIIMVEAIDAQRKKNKDPKKTVEVATGKISKAMIAATSTAALSFAPLIFVGGILGSFIRAIPITIIAALVTSLLVALIFIPTFAKYLLLGKKQMGEENVKEIAAGVEAKIARFISAPMLWAKNSRKKLLGVGITAVLIGFAFIGTGGYLFQKVTFNIFPPSKDSNQLSVVLTFDPGTDITKAQEVADRADKNVGKVVDTNFVTASYFGQADIQSATLTVNLTDYKARDIRAPEISKQLKESFAGFQGAKVQVGQIDAGPPASDFTAQIESSTDRQASLRLANDMAKYLETTKLTRIDGSEAKIETVSVANPGVYTSKNGKEFVAVTAKFVDDDTTTLVTLAKDAVNKEFNEAKIKSYGLPKDAINFDFGQEDENQDSFKTLAIAFPALLLAIYFLLAFEFRSLMQPLLIFTALPFSLFGITLGLYLTDNAFSFFAMLGFFALIGLSIKNTILLTDYANQSRRAGMGSVDAAHEALAERFRPLIATSLTAVVSLIPLAIMSPFWEGLAVVLIGGLLSSTFLVITVFPYYYLGSEFLRNRISRKYGIGWLVLTILLSVALSNASKQLILLGPILATAILIAISRSRRTAS